MFNTEQLLEIRAYLDQITLEIRGNKFEDENGPYWLVPFYPTPTVPYTFKQSSEIFNGDCGIGLFFLALYELDKNLEHLSIATQIFERVTQKKDIKAEQFYCLYSGVTDWIYMALRLFEVTGEHQYLQKALNIAKQHKDDIVNKVTKYDLLSGHAGSLLVFCQLYIHTLNQDILLAIHRLLEHFVSDARISNTGLKWEHDKYAYDSLAGFSHGASGIAFILMQVGQALGYDGLIYLAKEALDYEMQYYDGQTNNWLDLRMGFTRINLPDAHKWNLDIFLPHIRNVNSWAHGAAGIGAARAYAHEVTGDETYLNQSKNAFKRCKKDILLKRPDYTLCTGYAGYAFFLLRYQQITESSEIPELLITICRDAFSMYSREGTFNTFIETNQFDFGLFSGKTGIAYMLVKLLSKNNSPDIVFPQLPKSDQLPNISAEFSVAGITFRLFSKYFKRTIHELQKVTTIDPFYSRDVNEFADTLSKLLQQNFFKYSLEYANDVFQLELKMVLLWKTHKGALSIAKRSQRTLAEFKILEATTNSDLLSKSFVLSSRAHLHYSYFDPDDSKLAEEKLQLTRPAILFILEDIIEIIRPGKLASLLLENLVSPQEGNTLLQIVISRIKHNALTNKELCQVKNNIIAQLRELLRQGIVEAHS